METTKSNENATSAGSEFKETNTAIIDMYSKQLNLVTSFYTNFFNSMMGGNGNKGWNQDKGFAEMYHPANELSKIFSNSFGGNMNNNFQNPFLGSFEKVCSQLADYNRNLFTAFNNETKTGNVDLNAISKRYKDTIDSRLEASQHVLKSATEAYNKQFDTAVETNKKMMEDINTQFSSVVKQTQKFWNDILKTNTAPLTEEDAYVTKESAMDGTKNVAKEPVVDVTKKTTNVPVNEFMDHKGK